MYLRVCFFVFCMSSLIWSCAQIPTVHKTVSQKRKVSFVQKKEVPFHVFLDQQVSDLEKSLDAYHLIEEKSNSKRRHFRNSEFRSKTVQKVDPKGQATVHRLVQYWISYFMNQDHDRFQRFLNRGARYQEVVQSILAENGVPPELYFLGLIESGYQLHAQSRSRAVGAWQFMRATARRYGLRLDTYVDERRDPIRATEAAAKYLRDLYTVFQSWYLAMAAYNAGEFRILNAIMRVNTRNFWKLVEKKALPKETMHYVPKFLAAVMIGSQPEKFGFSLEKSTPFPEVEAIAVPSPVRLRDLARVSGVPYHMLKRLNPHLRKGVTPPDVSEYEIWVPVTYVSVFREKKPLFAKLKIRGLRYRRYASYRKRFYHRVRRGENLFLIAKRYRISVAFVKRINDLRKSRIYPGQLLRVSLKRFVRPKKGHYRVRHGDSLYSISRKFGISIRSLKKLNRLFGNRIYVGQHLRVRRGRI